MDVGEYKSKIVELLKIGDENVLKDAANCVFICSQSGYAASGVIDRKLGENGLYHSVRDEKHGCNRI